MRFCISTSKTAHRSAQDGLLIAVLVCAGLTYPARSAKKLNVVGGRESSSSDHSEEEGPTAQAVLIFSTRRIAVFSSSVPRAKRTRALSRLPTTEYVNV